MHEEIEFHDSKIVAITQKGTSLCICLEAYVHRWEMVTGSWVGTGWMRPIQIVVSSATCAKLPQIPVELCGGILRTSQMAYDNVVALPFASSTPTGMSLELETGSALNVRGQGIMIASTGPGCYVEQLPDDFRPKGNG